MDPESELVERARWGDPRARAALAERFYAAVYSLAFKLTGRPETAREVAQETFLRAFAHLDQHDPEHSFASWIFKIASNHVRDLLRREEREDPPPGPADRDPGAEAILQKHEDVERVRRALETLPSGTRAALILHLQEGLSVREIAHVLETSAHAARMKIYRGLQKVRERVREEP